MRLTTYIFAFLLAGFPAMALSAEPVKAIFDTDMSGDCDDAGALALLNKFADQGEAEILACVVNGRDQDKAAAAVVSAINTYYGRPNIPIGTFQGKRGPLTKSKYTAKVRDEFPHTAPPDDRAPTALNVYRKALAAAPDSSVVIISVGFLSNLHDLIDSKPDQLSNLTGLDLVRKKVKRLVVMGGQFPNDGAKKFAEYNFTFQGVGIDTQQVVEQWPGEMLFDGFSIGQGLGTGKSLANTPAANPVRRVYELYDDSVKKGRSSWDLCAVIAAIHDPRKYWTVMEDGHCRVNEKGVNDWVATPHRGHAYLTAKTDAAEMVKTIDGWLALAPARPASNPAKP